MISVHRHPSPDLRAVSLTALLAMLIAISGCSQTLHSDPRPSVVQVSLYFNNDSLAGETAGCDRVFPVSRSVASSSSVPDAALRALFSGPTPQEHAQGYRSFFSERTAGLLQHLKIESATAYVDLQDLRHELSGITSSCGYAEFFTQIQRTLSQFPGIQRVIFALDGNPQRFYAWVELECDRHNDHCDPTPFAHP